MKRICVFSLFPLLLLIFLLSVGAAASQFTMGYRPGPEDRFVGYKIGSTWYDCQHHGSMGRQIAQGVDRRIHFAWMHKGGPLSSDYCAAYYNSAFYHYVDSTWEFSHDTSGFEIQFLNGGFANCDVFSNKAMVSFHAGLVAGSYSSYVALDMASGAGVFNPVGTPTVNCSGAHSNGTDGDYLWPIVHLDDDGSSDPVVHVLATESDNGHLLKSMIYFRGVGPGFTYFGTCGTYIDSVAVVSGLVRQDPNSHKVAIIWIDPRDKSEVTGNELNNDVVYIESLDLGLTWGAKINVTNYQDTDPERAYTNLTAMYDHNGCLHIVWDAPSYNHTTGQGSDQVCKLRHWDNCHNCISLVIDADNTQSCGGPGRGNRNVTKQNLSECYDPVTGEHRLYLTYTYFCGNTASGTEDCSAAGYANGEIYAQVSTTGGETWGPPVNLTNTPDNGCLAGDCESEHWSSSVMYTSDSLRLLYVGDTDAGGWAGGGSDAEGSPTECPLMFHSVDCFPMERYVHLKVSPAHFSYPFHTHTGQTVDTGFTVTNVGNDSAFYVVTIVYLSGTDWLSVLPTTGTIPAGCINSDDFTMFATGPASEGIYQAEIKFTYEGGAKVLTVPVEIYVTQPPFPEPVNVRLHTVANALNVSEVSRIAVQETGAQFSWFSDSSNYIYDGSLIIGNARDNLNMRIFSAGGRTPDNPRRQLIPRFATTIDSTSYSAYQYAEGTGCTEDSTIEFKSRYYAPKHTDSAGFYVAHFDLYAGPGWVATVTNLIVAYAVDWDIPADTNTDNAGGFDSLLQLLYQQGQYAGSPEQNDIRYGGVAYRGDKQGNAQADGGFVWDNERYVYPDSGYHVDSLMKYLPATDSWSATAMIDDLNSILVIDRDAAIGAADTFSFSIIIVASNDGLTRSLADLHASVVKAEEFICDHVVVDAPHCLAFDCMCGDTDGNELWNISDIVRLIGYMFGGQPPPQRECLGDADGNCAINIADVVYLITYIFSSGAAPVCSANAGEPGCYEW
ncbi:MAG: exo-alpha-sialidase [candidate division Zixibacteria bacterium]|nr:exo-alpha-sialidase [candidate division Zixibacteria bacterium]